MGKFRREEDEADRWLRTYDPYYTNMDRNKRKKAGHFYETPEQEHRRKMVEVPISNLNSYQREEVRSVAGEYDENGDFNW